MSEAQARSQIFSLENHDLVRSWLVSKNNESKAISDFMIRARTEDVTYEELGKNFEKALTETMEIEKELLKRAEESGILS